MTLWPGRKSWSLHARSSRILSCIGVGLLGLIVRPGSASAIVVDRAPPPHYGFKPGREGPRSLVFVLPAACWRDLRRSGPPNLRALSAAGGAGLMPGSPVAISAQNGIWATLGAGRAAVGPSVAPAPAAIDGKWRVDLSEVRSANARAHTGAAPGALGQALHEVGLTTAVVSPGTHGGEAALALADGEGVVDGVWAGEGLTAAAALRGALVEALRQHAVILVDLSAMDSLEAADQVIGAALDVLWTRGRYLVIALSPTAGAAGRDVDVRLSPIVVREIDWPTGSRPGLLTSASTRWEGLVTAADVGPTLLQWWESTAPAPTEMSGRVIRIRESDQALEELDRLDLMLLERDRLLEVAAGLYVVYMGALILAALVVGVWRRGSVHWLTAPALVGALLPVGLLLATLAGLGQARQLFVAAGVAVGGALAALRLPRSEQSLAAAMLAGAAVIAADTILGSPLMRRSALGFSVVSGSRFYGIGNECVGVLGAMAAIGLGSLLQQRPRPSTAAVLIGVAVALAVGMPWWGANWGGYVAVMAGLVSIWVLTSKRRARAAALGVLLIVVAAFVPVLLDLLRPVAERTHIGSAAALLRGQADVLADTAWRKVHMNWGLAVTAGRWWALAPLAGLAALGMLQRGGPARQVLAGKRCLSAGMWGAVVSALVAMVLNDSGVVSLAVGLAVWLSVLIFIGARGR